MHPIVIRPVYQSKACLRIIHLLLKEQQKEGIPRACHLGVVFTCSLCVGLAFCLFVYLAPASVWYEITSPFWSSLLSFFWVARSILFRLFFFTLLFIFLNHIYSCKVYCKCQQVLWDSYLLFYTLDNVGITIYAKSEALDREKTIFYRYSDCRRIYIKSYGILFSFHEPLAESRFLPLSRDWFEESEYRQLTDLLRELSCEGSRRQ